MSDKQRKFNPLRVFPSRKRGSTCEKSEVIVSLAGLTNPNFENEFTKYRSFGARIRARLRVGKMWNKCVGFAQVFWSNAARFSKNFLRSI